MAKKQEVLVIRIDSKLKSKLEAIADLNNKSASEYTRRLIEDAVKKKKIF